MRKVAMLGSGFIGRFYADSIVGLRSKDKIVSIYSRSEANARKFAEDYDVPHFTTNMKEAIEHEEVDTVIISLPNHLHEEAVMACVEAKKGVLCTKHSGATHKKPNECSKLSKKAAYLMDIWKIWYTHPSI